MIYEKKRGKSALVMALCIVMVLLSVMIPVKSVDGKNSAVNRFNVVLVLDASNSMNYTDPSGLRYEAVSQFTNLLAEEGNYLGGIVFSNHVEAQRDMGAAEGQKEKTSVVDLLKSVKSSGVTADMGYTNVGEALDMAMKMLEGQESNGLPSVILLLSDGNTEMPTDEEKQKSLDQKADAIQRARNREIPIYTVCLNANGKADTTEMGQISEATGGTFQEVSEAKDLQGVFQTFYGLIYGTSPVTLAEDVFPDSGVLETHFTVPKAGVEEVNIIISGNVSAAYLQSPDGNEAAEHTLASDTYTFMKVTQAVPGEWRLYTEGVPGNGIQINMIYNSDLEMTVNAEPKDLMVHSGRSFAFKTLLQTDRQALSMEEYNGYGAEVDIKDAYGNLVRTIPMDASDDGFSAEIMLEEGTYYALVRVKGYGIEKESDIIGPMLVGADIKNTAPEPKENPVKKNVYLWPFQQASLTLDMSELAKDAEDKKLTYQVVSSAFVEGEDYEIDGDYIVMKNFSLSKGAFDILAVDSGGLSCHVEVIVQSYQLGVMAIIAVAAGTLLVLLAMGIIVYKKKLIPFMGTVSVQKFDRESDEIFRPVFLTPGRGSVRLEQFIQNPGFAAGCRFQAGGRDKHIYFVSKKPVYSDITVVAAKKIKIEGSGAEVNIYTDAEREKGITVTFASYLYQHY